MRRSLILIAAFVLTAPVQGRAQMTAFDGLWNVMIDCPPARDGVKAYTRIFSAEVKNGELQGTYGKEGELGWQSLHGKVLPDGSADLTLDGVIKNSDYALKNSPRGKPFSYKVQAKFEGSSGVGQRTTGRVCKFSFTR